MNGSEGGGDIELVEHELADRSGYQALVLRLKPKRLDMPGLIATLREAMLEVISRERRRLVVIDFSEVEQWNSEALGMLVRIYKKVREGGGAVRVAGLCAALAVTYRLCMLDRVIPSSRTVKEALDAHEAKESRRQAMPSSGR